MLTLTINDPANPHEIGRAADTLNAILRALREPEDAAKVISNKREPSPELNSPPETVVPPIETPEPPQATLAPTQPSAMFDPNPWDARIHAQTKSKTADGNWKYRRMPKEYTQEQWKEFINNVEAEISGNGAATADEGSISASSATAPESLPVTAGHAAPPVNIAPPPPPTENSAPPPPVPAGGHTFGSLLSAIREKGIPADQVNEVILALSGGEVTSIALLGVNQSLITPVAQALGV